MEQKRFVIDDRQFRTEQDYRLGLRDKELIEQLSREIKAATPEKRRTLLEDIRNDKYRFHTLLGEDFKDGLEEKFMEKQVKRSRSKTSNKTDNSRFINDSGMEEYVKLELQNREKRRKLFLSISMILGMAFLTVFGLYVYTDYQNESINQGYKDVLKEEVVMPHSGAEGSMGGSIISGPQFTLESMNPDKKVLDEYKNLLNKYENLIGWLKIDDTNIDYPVMQTEDNVFYLDHNPDGKYDRNGTIFLDKDCDAVNGSTNMILYGHHMKSGKMFGQLNKYSDKSFYDKHRYIQFDTIYEKGTYEVMYVFRSRVYKEDEVVFKYYQFIEVNGEKEFLSNMDEMAAISLYSTGVTASYGDKLLTLSTCDYEEKNGRFVVVARKITTKE